MLWYFDIYSVTEWLPYLGNIVFNKVVPKYHGNIMVIFVS